MDPARVRGAVDFGIITIREDEFAAVLERFPEEIGIASGRRQYNLRRLAPDDPYTVAVVRCAAQGNSEAQQVANALLDELAPRWLLVVGIAGAAPAREHSLGDVIVSTQVADFNVGAALKDGEREYALTSWVTHPEAQKHAANLPALRSKLMGWNSAESITARRPEIRVSPKALYGDSEWKRKVKQAIEPHKTRAEPLVTAGAIACSDLLMKDADLFKVWLKIARQVIAVEMESAGVHRAAHERQTPVLSIRGVSDVVGLSRDNDWTPYACHAAAAFTRAFLLTRPLPERTTAPAPVTSGGDRPLPSSPPATPALKPSMFPGVGPRAWAWVVVALVAVAAVGAAAGRVSRWARATAIVADPARGDDALVHERAAANTGFRCKGPAIQLYTRPVFHGPKFDYTLTREALKRHPELEGIELFEFEIESTNLQGKTQQYVLVGVAPDSDKLERLRAVAREINPGAGNYISCPAIQPRRKLNLDE